MKKTIITLIILALIAGGCKNQSKNRTEQESDVCVSISEKYSDSVETPPENKNEIEIDTENYTKFKSKYNFATFSTEVFTGKLAKPDFTNNEFAEDREYVDFITEGCNEKGINFGGHYTIIERSCGCMCLHIFIVDRISGKIHTNIKLNNGKWGYLYQPDSKLLIANSELFTRFDSLTHYCNQWNMTPELYIWTDKKFKRIQ